MLKLIKSNLDIIFLFLIIYCSDDTIVFGMNRDMGTVSLKYVVWAIFSIYAFNKTKRLNNKSLSFLIFLLVFFSVAVLFTSSGFGAYYMLALVLVAMLYSELFEYTRFKDAFNKLLFFLSVYSLVIYVISNVNLGLLSVFPKVTDSIGQVFNNCIFSVVFDVLRHRNFGIFREPGVYMCYLNVALFFELFSSKKPRMLFVLIYILTLATTISTSGYIIAVLIFITYIIHNRKVNIPMLILLASMGVVYYFVSTDELYSMYLLGKLENQTGTYVARVSSITVPLEMIKINPLGVGTEGYNTLFPSICSRLYSYALEADMSTNTLLKYAAVYGIFVGIMFFYAVLRFSKKYSKNLLIRYSLLLVILLFSSNEDLRMSFLFLLIVSYGVNPYLFRELEQNNGKQ